MGRVHHFPREYSHLHADLQKRIVSKVSRCSGIKSKDERIKSAIAHSLLYSGPGISRPLNPPQTKPEEMAHYLLHGGPFPSITRELLKSFFLRRDEPLFTEFREIFRKTLTSLWASKKNYTEALFDQHVGHVLSLLVFAFPHVGERFSIPTKVKGKWELVEYTVTDRIELTPSWFSSPMLAFGLVPDNKEAKALLIPVGTVYPSGSGSLASLLADSAPAIGIGTLADLLGGAKMLNFLTQHPGTHLIGNSLGAMIVTILYKKHTALISRAQGYGAPGFFPWSTGRRFDDDPSLILYGHEGDIITKVGYFLRGHSVHHVRCLRGERGRPLNPLGAHAQAPTGFSHVTLIRVTAHKLNREISRHVLTFSFMIIGPLCFFFPALVLYLLQKLILLIVKIVRAPFTRPAIAPAPPSDSSDV